MTLTRGAPEKKVEKAGDELMAAFGFTAIRFSQARATMQTRGIPDRRYYRAGTRSTFPQYEPTLHYAVWWEAKAETKQSVHQRGFQELVQSCNEIYMCGGVEVLENYLVSVGLARRVPGGLEGVRAA